MFTLKRYTLPCPENDKDLFMYLYWDTEAHDASGWETFSRSKRSYQRDKMWLGYVDRDNQEFDICNAQAGLFKTRLSKFRIKGKIKRGIVSKTIEVEIGFGWPLITEALILIFFFATGAITARMVLWLVWAVSTLLVVLLFDDFYGSEELIKTYLKDPTKVSKLVIKK